MVGIDIVDVSRMEGIVKRFGDRFLHRVFTGQELEYAGKKVRIQETLSGRFAAKEAFMKAINTLAIPAHRGGPCRRDQKARQTSPFMGRKESADSEAVPWADIG